MDESHARPRIVIAAPGSGSGKTTIATGVMAALHARGCRVAGFKVGPDYIDPGYHSLATGGPGRNLDPFLCGEDLVAPLFLHGSAGAEVSVIEGVMGLYDGRLGHRGFGSTAHVAILLDAPVLLVVDARHSARTVGAIVQGMTAFDPRVRLAGVILNQVGSQRHAQEATNAVAELDLPVLGVLPRSLDIESPSRHLGLVPAAERDDAKIAAMGEIVARHVDLDALLRTARAASLLRGDPWRPEAMVSPPSPATPVVAVAGGRAFTFRYPETDELLAAAGCRLVEFDPLRDPALPEGTAGIWLGGGFPEVYAAELAANRSLLEEVRRAVGAGIPTVAECAGLLYLTRHVDDQPMAAAIDAHAAMTPRLTLGYRTATSPRESLLGRPGEQITGHEFHRTQVAGAEGAEAWLLDGMPDGVASATLHASYLHIHWAGHPQLAQRFAEAVHAATPLTVRTPAPASAGSSSLDGAAGGVDLHHHGDQDLAPGLTDLAVNVRQDRTPPWLVAAVSSSGGWPTYPDPRAARDAIAARHRIDPAMVLPVAGVAEAFTLIARAIDGDSLVVHPQFTEPEVALLAAGRRPRRHLLRARDGFRIIASQVPPADLILVGNPTNPTGVLHSADMLTALPARTLVIDEAFLDAIPGQPGSLIAPAMPGRLVLRSLTKTWALAGLRAGYVVGDPELIDLLAAQQPPWSVSTPALLAMKACLGEDALTQAEQLARQAMTAREDLAARLEALGLAVVPGRAPFVLVDTSSIAPVSLREPLARLGFGVRRGESFPGLGPTWLRLAVRTPDIHHRLAEALATIRLQGEGS